MIASVRGTVQAVRLDAAVVEVGGVGMLVQATPATLAGLRVGSEALLATSLVVREDSLTLFGFADADEREVFEVVQTVSGVGPRLALAMLAVHTPDGLRRAVAGEDLAALMRVPGIGRKGAQRIVLELGDRLGAPAPTSGASPVAAAAVDDRRDQVVEALVGLGWTAKSAGDAVASVLEDTPGPVAADEVAGVLRAALRTLGGGHG
ncbi:Holliday junction branch migration protein RuvA [Cellulomonas biazotea]|uniref:Holliday junction branch migration complex subunit RuvA n=1 Tax=Cellulomonas biazotea TaxID=1709 RepID=A0A402DM50_9CELL|nr:Holliday junction branch migration protein RuvA [Cellulomonas biazotea]GCE75158.1 Holliday junction ATP-dependent DNA helicase RuvA [Cellulomonas biazotea]